MSGNIRWSGRDVPFVAGETLAQALNRAGIQNFGTSPSRQPYSVFCGIGQCQNCLVDIDDKGPGEACLTFCHDGLVANPLKNGHG